MKRALGGLVVLAALLCPSGAPAGEHTYRFMPWPQSWTAPSHVTTATFDVYGGEGAGSIYFPSARGGLGGRATATIEVVPGRTYDIEVGRAGPANPDPTQLTTNGGYGSEVLFDSTRIIAAGGGGGGSATDGGPGGTLEASSGSINGQDSSVEGGPGAGGASWGPPGTVYEVGVREGDGQITVSYNPDTRIVSGPSGLTNDDTPTFSFAADEPSALFGCFDERTFGDCSGPGRTHTAPPLPDGRHEFAVVSSDAFGNADPTLATRRFRVDTRPPALRFKGRPPKVVRADGKRTRVKVRFRSSERRTSFRCRLDGGEYRPCKSPYAPTVSASHGRGEKHRISVRGVDAAGNTAPPASLAFRVVRRG